MPEALFGSVIPASASLFVCVSQFQSISSRTETDTKLDPALSASGQLAHGTTVPLTESKPRGGFEV